MRVHPGQKASRARRGLVAAAGISLVSALIAYGGAAAAAPGPTAGQVRQKISKLMTQLDRVDQQYAQSAADLASASTRLTLINRRLGQAQRSFETARAAVARIASAAYEQGNLNSAMAMLASDNPQAVLDRASVLSHLSSDGQAQVDAFLAAARTLRDSQQQQQRTRAAIVHLRKQRAAQKQRLQRLVDKNQAQLNKLTPPSATSGGSGVTAPVAGTGAARIAVQYALSKVGDAYVWGATGPDTFDCSGLVMQAWASAGVSIPRTTYEQWAALPHIPASGIRPGDLAFFDAEGHVAMYIGNGKYVDAPQPGQNVEVVPVSESWYASNLDGYARP
ncbi:MAG: NlpC/P60 family protein [Micromonosporaceae bacterium]